MARMGRVCQRCDGRSETGQRSTHGASVEKDVDEEEDVDKIVDEIIDEIIFTLMEVILK